MSSSQSLSRSSTDRFLDYKARVTHFLLQVQMGHARTRDSEPVPLHFDSTAGTLVPYLWPVDPATLERIRPSEFESHRRTHELRAPCCLCAIVEGKGYTEARIGIAETVTQDLTGNQPVLNGEIVAVCGKQQCGYFLCLERFYPLRDLKSRACPQRPTPLPPTDVSPSVRVDNSFRVGDGLFQVMADAVIRGARNEGFEIVKPKKEMNQAVIRELTKGMTEERFWGTFVQCLFCKAVIFRETFGANHACDIERRQSRRFNPYTTPTKVSPKATRPRAIASRLQQTYALAYIPSSPTPPAFPGINEGRAPPFSEGSKDIKPFGNGNGEVSSEDLSETARDEDEGRASGSSVLAGEASSDTEEEPIFSSDVELPSITQVFEQWRREKRAARRSG